MTTQWHRERRDVSVSEAVVSSAAGPFVGHTVGRQVPEGPRGDPRRWRRHPWRRWRGQYWRRQRRLWAASTTGQKERPWPINCICTHFEQVCFYTADDVECLCLILHQSFWHTSKNSVRDNVFLSSHKLQANFRIFLYDSFTFSIQVLAPAFYDFFRTPLPWYLSDVVYYVVIPVNKITVIKLGQLVV